MSKRCSTCGILLNNDENNIKCDRCKNSLYILSETNFFRSLIYILEGFSLLVKNKKLLKLSAIPILITFFLLVMTYSTALYLLVDGLNQYLPAIENQGYFGIMAKYVFGFIGTIVIGIIVVFLFLPISSLVCIPFNDLLSVETEKVLLGESIVSNKTDFIKELKVGLIEMFKLIAFKIICLFILIPLIFVPVVGHLLFIFGISLITAIDFIDLVMARKSYTLKEKIDFIKNNLGDFIAFSLPLLILFWVPVIQVLLIPCATIGGTKFFIQAYKKNKIE